MVSREVWSATMSPTAKVKIGVLVGSVLAVLVAAAILRRRNRAYRLICETEETDSDTDGIPDVFDTRP